VVPIRSAAGPDTLAARAGMDLRTVLRRLTLLDDLGLITRRDGGYLLSRNATARRSTPTAPPADDESHP
jgi:DNA processing protein